MAGSEGTAVDRSCSSEESPLPKQTVAGSNSDSPLCEGPLLSALLNKMESILDQVGTTTWKYSSKFMKFAKTDVSVLVIELL